MKYSMTVLEYMWLLNRGDHMGKFWLYLANSDYLKIFSSFSGIKKKFEWCAICTYHRESWEFETRSWRGELDTTLCDKVCQWLAAGRWFSPGTHVSSTNRTDCHDITEILLKVAWNTKNQPSQTNYFSPQGTTITYKVRRCWHHLPTNHVSLIFMLM